jgi:hypothetical protein
MINPLFKFMFGAIFCLWTATATAKDKLPPLPDGYIDLPFHIKSLAGAEAYQKRCGHVIYDIIGPGGATMQQFEAVMTLAWNKANITYETDYLPLFSLLSRLDAPYPGYKEAEAYWVRVFGSYLPCREKSTARLFLRAFENLYKYTDGW